MRILILDTESNALSWAMRCQDAGHNVVWFDRKHKDGSCRMAGKGLVPKLIDYDALRDKYFDWADLIFLCDNAHYTDLVDPYRRDGYPVFGPSPEAADLELDRDLGQAAMEKAGLKIIPGEGFHDYAAAARFVEKNPTYLVSKPSGEADKALSYVASRPDELVYMLEQRWAQNSKYVAAAKEHGFILQEKKDGVEFAVGGWFGPGGWSPWWYENFEHKKLMANDLGPNTGEMGTVSMYVSKSKLADIALKPMTKQLEAMDYVGFIDISGMIDEAGEFWPFEFTMRPGWPTFQNQIATHEGDPAQWMLDCINGYHTLEVKENVVCVSVLLAIGDFPHSHLTNKEVTGLPLYGATDLEHVHLCEVMVDKRPEWINGKMVNVPGYVTCGDYVAIVTGLGQTITGARKSAYAAMGKLKTGLNPFYRPDIGGARIRRGLPEIQKHGFATEFKIM